VGTYPGDPTGHTRRHRWPGRRLLDDRACLTGVLFVVLTGITWHDLPQQLGYGSGMTCWRRLRDWHAAGIWDQLHQLLISADEKSQLQALSRCHPELSPAPGRVRRVEFEYERHGTLAYFGAYDVHQARLMGRVEPTTGIAPFGRLVDQVMSSEPYASAKRVFWVVDNGSSHAGQASINRMREACPTATLVHLPVHASWLNQIEIVYSVIRRKIIKPAAFADLDALAQRLVEFRVPLQRHRETV
jgi:transposase